MPLMLFKVSLIKYVKDFSRLLSKRIAKQKSVIDIVLYRYNIVIF